MNRRPDPKRIEVVDDSVAEILRGKTFTERAAMVFECNRTMRLRLKGHLQTCHPDWTEEQLESEIARRMLGGTE